MDDYDFKLALRVQAALTVAYVFTLLACAIGITGALIYAVIVAVSAM